MDQTNKDANDQRLETQKDASKPKKIIIIIMIIIK